MKLYKILAIIFTIGMCSCEQERLQPVLTTADGGGTLNTYTAYTINSTDPMGSNVYGRVVFYKTTLDQTLVQISLYNTLEDIMHPAVLIEGSAEMMGTTAMITLENVNGTLGEFTDKFYVIDDTSFYDAIMAMDAHVSISLSAMDDTIVATGDIGINADPVETN